MPSTHDPVTSSPADSPSPAVRAAHRRVERARGLGQLPPDDAPHRDPSRAATDARSAAGGRARPSSPGRGTHVIDRALAYRRHAAAGMSAVAIARRVRKSKGHVSILLRLGAAIEGMEPGELAALRTPAVTWRLVQRLVRGDTRVQTDGERKAAVVGLRRALRDTLGGFSAYTVDRRRHRKGRTPGAPALERFDPGAFAADPAGFVAGHLERLVAAHEAVARQALRILDGALAAERLAAVPLAALARMSRPQLAAVAARGREHLSADQQCAVDALEAASRVLGGLASAANLARAGRRPPTGAGDPGPPRPDAHPPVGLATGGGRGDPHAPPAERITADDIEADLAD